MFKFGYSIQLSPFEITTKISPNNNDTNMYHSVTSHSHVATVQETMTHPTELSGKHKFLMLKQQLS